MASFTVFSYFLLLLVGGFLYLVFLLVADVFNLVQNIFLDNFPGVITEQTVTAVNFCTGALLSAPFLLVLTISIWAIVKGGTN